MSNLTISTFGSKIFLEIISEIKLFSKFKIKYYENLDLCIKDAEEQNLLVVFFANKENIKLFSNNKSYNFPSILITEVSIPKVYFSSEIREEKLFHFLLKMNLKKIH